MCGVLVLVVSLYPLWKLLKKLAAGPVRSQWLLLGMFNLVFIGGYVSYAAVYWDDHHRMLDLVVPIIFFCGAVFVFLVCSLSLQTARELIHIHTLRQESITDPLMGIYNRRYLDLQIRREFERARRYKLPLTVFLLDIDHFKRVNDDYGHLAGDQVLRKLGQLLLSSLRNSDIAARYGGEEMLVILPDTDISQSAALAERLRQTIRDLEVELPSKKDKNSIIQVNVSIGVAGYDTSVKTYNKLIENADTALYQAKENGRNQVQVYNKSEYIN